MSDLRVERRGPALVLTIDREAAGNSISAEVSADIEKAIEQIRTDGSLYAVIITGAGEKFFSAGGDIKRYRALETRDQLAGTFEGPRRLMDKLEALPVPVVAAVNGYALGGGAELMLACDLRIAGRSARIGFPYVKLGLIAGWHGVERLVRDCGHGAAMELLATGDPVNAERAERIGLINRVVDDGAAVATALELAAGFAKSAPLALAASKRILKASWKTPPAEFRAMMDQAFADLWMSQDHREAEAAFAEKRKPRFNGK